MSNLILIANGLVILTFIMHTFGGDKEYKSIEPEKDNVSQLEKWTMGRGAFHIVSADFLLASIGLTLINFSDYFTDKKLILNILAVYFAAYGLAFFLALLISKKFSYSFIKLWQWLLMFIISGLIYFGTN
jgi:hypothetical protein